MSTATTISSKLFERSMKLSPECIPAVCIRNSIETPDFNDDEDDEMIDEDAEMTDENPEMTDEVFSEQPENSETFCSRDPGNCLCEECEARRIQCIQQYANT